MRTTKLKQVLFKVETLEAFQAKTSEENKKLTGKCFHRCWLSEYVISHWLPFVMVRTMRDYGVELPCSSHEIRWRLQVLWIFDCIRGHHSRGSEERIHPWTTHLQASYYHLLRGREEGWDQWSRLHQTRELCAEIFASLWRVTCMIQFAP